MKAAHPQYLFSVAGRSGTSVIYTCDICGDRRDSIRAIVSHYRTAHPQHATARRLEGIFVRKPTSPAAEPEQPPPVPPPVGQPSTTHNGDFVNLILQHLDEVKALREDNARLREKYAQKSEEVRKLQQTNVQIQTLLARPD